jgi:hypothetical protein
MGAWGPKLYQDDVAEDVRDDYKSLLKKGLSDEEATVEIIKNSGAIGDIDDEPVFWFALADCQWKAGRLLPEVKNKAIEWINKGSDQKKWLEESPKEAKVRTRVLADLKKELETEQPEKKQIKIPVITKCEWKIGDVYAFKLQGDLAQEKGLYGKYIVMIKVGERKAAEGHIVPEVYVLRGIFDETPNLNDVNNYEYIKQAYYPSVLKQRPDLVKYRIEFETCSKRVMPIKQLVYIGNLGNELRVIDKDKNFVSDFNRSHLCFWRRFESYIIEIQLRWLNEE